MLTLFKVRIQLKIPRHSEWLSMSGFRRSLREGKGYHGSCVKCSIHNERENCERKGELECGT